MQLLSLGKAFVLNMLTSNKALFAKTLLYEVYNFVFICASGALSRIKKTNVVEDNVPEKKGRKLILNTYLCRPFIQPQQKGRGGPSGKGK